MVEMIVAMVLSALALTGAYRLWKFQQTQSLRIQNAIEARNQLALSSNLLSKSITLAGYGMNDIPGMVKSDEEGSDTLIIYSNPDEAVSTLESDYTSDHSNTQVRVVDGSMFSTSAYVGVTDGVHGEVRKVASYSSGRVRMTESLSYNYSMSNTRVYPIVREKYYSDQASKYLIRMVNDQSQTIGEQVRNFQVSFRDKNGVSTESLPNTRNVFYSVTGDYAPIQGTINSIIYTNTAVPRNLL